MKVEDINRIINKIEQKFEVDQWEIEGLKLWPFIRIENYMLLSYKVLRSDPLPTRSYNYALKIIKSKFNHFFAIILDFKNKTNLEKKDVCFLSDGFSNTKLKSKWFNKFCDPLAYEFSLRGFTSIRLDLSHNFFFPRHSPSIFIQPFIDNIIIRILLYLKVNKPMFSNENWLDYEFFLKDNYVQQNLISIPSKEVIRKRIAKIKSLKYFYIKQLKSIMPKIAFVVNYYGDEQMAFVLACKDLCIPCVDLQHGVQGPMHLSYGNWSKVPEIGYSQMPNYFWVWSEREKSSIEKWSLTIKQYKVLVGGNLFNEMWKDNTSALVIELDKEFEELKLNKNKKSILITLSPHTDSLMRETWEAIKVIQYDYNCFVRVHPVMVKDIKKIQKKLFQMGIINFEIKVSSKLPLQTILRNIDVHVTSQSSCVIEAIDFGVKSIITSDYGKSLYKEQIFLNYFIFVKSVEGIIKEIDFMANQNKVSVNNLSKNKNKNKTLDYIINKYLK